MKNKKLTRFICCILSCSLLLLPVSASKPAVGNNDAVNDSMYSEIVRDVSLLTFENIPDEVFDGTGIKAGVEEKQIKKIDLVDAEDMFSLTVINADGTKSAYSYNMPIKYLDEDTNQIKFIKNDLKYNGYFNATAYENTENSVKVKMSKRIADGVSVTDKDKTLNIVPEYKNNSVASEKTVMFSGEENTVIEYSNAFAPGVSLQYSAVNNGLKENIFINEYAGINEFSFIVTASGLTPDVQQGAVIRFIDDTTGEPAFVLNTPWIKDSYVGADDSEEEHLSLESYYKITTVSQGVYRLTLVADSEFLSSPDTVYPVLIDPPYATFGTSDLNYTSLFSSSSEKWTNTTYGMLGYRSGYGESLMYVQMSNVKNFKYINPNNISNVTLNMHQSYGTSSDYNISCYDSTTSVSVSSATYSTVNSNTGNFLDVTQCTTNATYGWWITSVFKAWLEYELSGNGWSKYQVILKAAQTGKPYKQFRCAENYMWVKIDYTVDSVSNGIYYIKNYLSSKYLNVEDTTNTEPNVNQYSFTGDINQLWYICSQGEGIYKVYSQLGNQYSKTLKRNGSNITAFHAEGNMPYLIFYIVSNNDTANTYRIVSSLSSDIRAVSVANSSTANSANVELQDYTGKSNQKWKLERVTDVSIMDGTPQIGQEMSNWCWIASSLMVAKRYYPETTVTQTDICMQVKGGIDNWTGSNKNMADAIKYASNNTVEYFFSPGIISENDLKEQLAWGDVVIVGMDGIEGPHISVIYGYVNYNGLRFLIRDPWPVGTGRSYAMTYSELKGTSSRFWDMSGRRVV